MSMTAGQESGQDDGCICPPAEDFISFPILFRHLKNIIDDNINYFQKYPSKSVCKRFLDAFERINETLPSIQEIAVFIAQRVTSFDYSSEVKGNGYRSLLRLLEQCIRALTELTFYCQKHRNRFYFRSHHYCLEIEAHTDLLLGTKDLLNYALTCMEESKDGQLFPESIDSKILIEAEMMDRECFYGRALGFQFRPGLRQFLQMVCVAMASFAEGYHRHKASPLACMTTAVLSSGKYTVNPEMRAKMIVKLTHKTNMEFCKAFWGLTEGFGVQHFPLFVCPALKVNNLFHIPAEPFEITSESGSVVSIAPPCSWSGLAPVQVRLMSFEWREGQSKDGSNNNQYSPKMKPKSKGLVLHIHGGGFVSQSSKSHEMYLRVWARDLNVPILSVDYSLAPEAPFPRALEECFFAYAWALKNLDKLGTTAEYVCIAGDSAGGNLGVAVCMRAAEYGIRRPDSLLAAYPPLNVQYVPSPSRLMSLMDPLLPTGILSACLGAYAGMGKSPFDECMKTPANSSLIAKQGSAPTPPVDIIRKGSFLSKFKRGKDSNRKSDFSPSEEFENPSGPGSKSFQSFPSPPTSDSVPKDLSMGNCSYVQNGLPSYGSPIQEGSSPEGEKYYSFKEENLETFVATNNDENLVRENDGFEQDENTKDISIQDLKLRDVIVSCSDGKHCTQQRYYSTASCSDGKHCTQQRDDSTVSCSDGKHCAQQSNAQSDRRRLLKLDVTPKFHVPLGENYAHQEMQYTRSNDECHVVNVVDPSLSPTGETMIIPIEEPSLRIGTPPMTEDEGIEEKEHGLHYRRSMSEVSLPIAKNPYMSPLVAPDEMLATLPPMDIVACSLDPLLDDSIEFARRLRSLGKDVEIYILEDLPHGFLNFNLVCQEAKDGCDLCTACLKRTLMGKRKLDRVDQAPVY
ncbi:hormone-sensitive lipase-like [Actinia tenebrosa]|uniref:Hormone-sensitive lipase n=1 Tax=Actinia tenebrosa TaxID=6105 RepID=A0A6P8IRJ7_ACTTE|nr:hormone-sensitive lipase-like [Actinia tenebrosa]